MKETKIKENILLNETMELNDVELESAAGGSCAPGKPRDLGVPPIQGVPREKLFNLDELQLPEAGILPGDWKIPGAQLPGAQEAMDQDWKQINADQRELLEQTLREMGISSAEN